jgi:3-oxosteroid 1-dehydrogenase
MMPEVEIARRESAAPGNAEQPFDVECDVVVVGGGAGGLPSALFNRWNGNEVVLLEKASELGGTANKAAFWYWVPNNEPMRALGLADDEDGFLRYTARLSQPQAYSPSDPTLGLTQWDYDLLKAIYSSASPAAELLKQKGALDYRHCPGVPDYWSELPEDTAPLGRVLVPRGARESMSDGGAVAVRDLSAAAERDGVDIRTGHRVQRTIVDGHRVIGVEATTGDGATVRVKARKAVIFASGGFTHDVELRRNFLSAPVYGGCAAVTNEGDFISIAANVGAQLRNMNYAWMCPIPLEKAVAKDPDMVGMFSVAGDSMIWVDKNGRRTVNEKLPYNELAQQFFVWDSAKGEYPNLVLIQVWDQRSQNGSASDEYGRLIVPSGVDDAHVIKGGSLGELAANIADRIKKYEAVTGGLGLSGDFLTNLRASVLRFNELAAGGVDHDLHRGEAAVQQLFNGEVAANPGTTNPTMFPISDEGPYYAALVTGGTLDTKGGPKVSPDGQVVDDTNQPIQGLYGVGNCVASASARAYWAGGATIGPIIAFAYRAAQAIERQSISAPS